MRHRITVVGSGPAGLTFARVLHRHDYPVAVLERDPAPDARPPGGTLDLHEGLGQLALDKAERKMRDMLAERGKSGEDRQKLLDELLAIIVNTDLPDEDIGGLIRGPAKGIGWERLRAAQATVLPRLPRDHGHLAALDSSYGYLRQFTPKCWTRCGSPGARRPRTSSQRSRSCGS